MAKNLLIVESPSKAKTIEKYLGPDFVVLSSKGHIRDLATTGVGGFGVDLEDGYKPNYISIRGKGVVVKELKKVCKDVDKVYIATDPDREGEAIGWHLLDVLKLSEKELNRVVFNEVTKDAVVKAVKNPRTIDMDVVRSQEARRIIDRIIGFKLSKLLQKKIKSKSAGRVQSVALQLVVDREDEINKFIKEEYWTIDAQYNDVLFKLDKVKSKKAEIKNEEESNKIIDSLKKEFKIKSIQNKDSKRNSKLPYTTSTLTQDGASKLHFGASKTMRIAQSLYEGMKVDNGLVGLITYMRTDSSRLSEVFVKQAFGYIASKYSKEYLGFYKGAKGNQDAHEGIRVTSINRTPQSLRKYLTDDEFKLYSMIYARSLASLMAPAVINTNTITLENNKCTFKASAQTLKFDGYLKVYKGYEQINESNLPDLKEGSKLTGLKVEGHQHFTKPKPRFTEAKLIKEMEENGIGRPSTYAATMKTLKDRGYAELISKAFHPTEQGTLTSNRLKEHFKSIINVEYTKNMEENLDKVSIGDKDRVETIDSFYQEFVPMVDLADKNMEKIPDVETGETCPECGGSLVIKKGRYGEFTACSNFPKCKYIKEDPNKPKKVVVDTGVKCPKCGKGNLVERTATKGRNKGNKFYACNKFPKCKFITNDLDKLD